MLWTKKAWERIHNCSDYYNINGYQKHEVIIIWVGKVSTVDCEGDAFLRIFLSMQLRILEDTEQQRR